MGTTRCYPLTITDAFSRYLIACVAMSRPDGTKVRRAMEQVFDEFGLPDAIRSDNGTPFASTGQGVCKRTSPTSLTPHFAAAARSDTPASRDP